jgi:phage-related protein
MFEIIFYDLENGICPVREFIDSLEPKMKAKVIHTIELLELNGTALRMPYSEYLEEGVFELRTKQGSDITRVLYFFYIGHKAVITNGFVKKTQKIPCRDIQIAKKYKADFERRYGK